MLDAIVSGTVRFEQPALLWLLMCPAALLPLWIWQVARRGRDRRRLTAARVTPAPEPVAVLGPLAGWFWLLGAAACATLALARPAAVLASVGDAAVDVVLLQDGSASMHVRDISPDRWQRSQRFVRALANAISWGDDRVALALFAHRAAPQLRLTRDPNALLFFLDHLSERPPFRLEDATTWDTNIEEGIAWGLRLLLKDEELFGPSGNVKAFVILSDGQAWSGRAQAALAAARSRRVRTYVVGIGTPGGGLIPEPIAADGTTPPSVHRSRLDRLSLQAIARAGGGDYFEIGREPDRQLAFRILAAVRRRAPAASDQTRLEPLYWRCLVAAAACIGAAVVVRT